MRPAGSYGEITRAVLGALTEQPGTLQDVLQRAPGLGYEATKATLANCSRQGAVRVVGQHKEPGARRWQQIYEAVPADARADASGLSSAPADCGVLVLVGALGAWR